MSQNLNGIEFTHLGYKIEDQEKWLFRNLNLRAKNSEFIALLGPSGCGKSTLLKLISRLENPSEGRIDYPEKSKLSFVFQDPCLLPWRTVRENISLPLENKAGNFKSKGEIKNRITEMLDLVKLKSQGDLYPHQLSGGMKMRVSIARALIHEPKILLMDEPFAALDEMTRFELQEELLKVWELFQMNVFFVTHSLQESVFLGQKIWCFPQGGIKSFTEEIIDFPKERNSELRASQEYHLKVNQINQRVRSL